MATKKPYQLGPNARKLDPKLRMIANGSRQVNVARSAYSNVVAISAKAAQRDSLRLPAPEASSGARKPKRGSLGQPSSDVFVNVFISTDRIDGLPKNVVSPSAQLPGLSVARVNLADLPKLAAQQQVLSVSLAQSLSDPDPSISAEAVSQPPASLRRFGSPLLHRNGRGVLIGIIDVQGFDFAHPDFMDAQGSTRWVRIWDQGGTSKPGATRPFGYGNVLTAAQMNKAIKSASNVGAPATELEPQSQMDPGSHGTHVASITAGNLGVCREAMLAGVLVSLGGDDQDRRRSFYDSSRLAHAVNYLIDVANEQKASALSINISLGTNGHAHDSSAAINRWIDAQLSIAGRSVCVAGGNAGQEKGESPTDFGFVMGRIHTSGHIGAAGLVRDLEWMVVGNSTVDVSENELELWFSPQDRIEISLRTPDGSWIGPVKPRQFIENQQLPDGSFISIYNELFHATNGANSIAVFLSPFLSPTQVVGIPSGKWIVRLHGLEIRDGRYHGWIERDDPQRLGTLGPGVEAWRFPSFFSESTNVDDSSVSTLACGQRIVSVANLDSARERIQVTSSQGPTRDGRQKPDIAAPGTDIVAAKGFAGPDDLWIEMTGTSMASPFAAGVIGLMLAIEPKLTAAQIGGILQRTAKPLPSHDFRWRNDSGFGAIDPEAAIEEAKALHVREDMTP